MKPTRQEIAEAAQRSIYYRWGPTVRGEARTNTCDLCVIFQATRNNFVNCKCPMNDEGAEPCCYDFMDWLKEESPEKQRIAAQAVVDKLERIVKEYSEEDNGRT